MLLAPNCHGRKVFRLMIKPMPLCLFYKPFSTTSVHLLPIIFSPRFMKRRSDSDDDADHQRDVFHYPSISHSDCDMCEQSSLSSRKTLRSYAETETSFNTSTLFSSHPSIFHSESDMCEESSLLTEKSLGSYAETEASCNMSSRFFRHPSLSYFESDMCEQSSLSSEKSLGSHAEAEASSSRRHHSKQISSECKMDLATCQSSGTLFEDSVDDHEDHLLPISFGKKKLNCSRRKVEKNHKSPADDLCQAKPFSLIFPGSTNSMSNKICQKHIVVETCHERSHNVLRSGMVLVKNYLSLSDQVEMVNICEELGVGSGGFYQPGYQNGAKLRLQMMCLGRNWDPQTKYDELCRSDGSKAPPIPDKLTRLVEDALKYAHDLVDSKDELPLMFPDICIVNFYKTSGRLGLHQDRDESIDSRSRGLPVVSFSVGDSAEFLYGDERDMEKAEKVLLESGDVLIFGGKSRHIYHGVKTVVPDSAPLPLLKQAGLRPGRLNLTFRQF